MKLKLGLALALLASASQQAYGMDQVVKYASLVPKIEATVQAITDQTIPATSAAVSGLSNTVSQVSNSVKNMTKQVNPSGMINGAFDVVDQALTIPSQVAPVIDALETLMSDIAQIAAVFKPEISGTINNIRGTMDGIKSDMVKISAGVAGVTPKLRASFMAIFGEVDNMVKAVQQVKF